MIREKNGGNSRMTGQSLTACLRPFDHPPIRRYTMLVAYGPYELTLTEVEVLSDYRNFPGLTAVRAANRF